MKATPYYEQRHREHGITHEQVLEALESEVERNVQPSGRIQVWGFVRERGLYARVILLEDGETLLNAFFDENYTRKRGRP